MYPPLAGTLLSPEMVKFVPKPIQEASLVTHPWGGTPLTPRNEEIPAQTLPRRPQRCSVPPPGGDASFLRNGEIRPETIPGGAIGDPPLVGYTVDHPK